MFSNMPTMLQAQDFQAKHADMVEAARAGKTVEVGLDLGEVVVKRAITFVPKNDYRAPPEGSNVIAVEAANQCGCSLVVHALPFALGVGQVFVIADVVKPDGERREFIVTAAAAKGHRVIHFYPPLSLAAPATVRELPAAGARIFVLRAKMLNESGVESEFADDGAKIGAQLPIRLPNDFAVSDHVKMLINDLQYQCSPSASTIQPPSSQG